MEGEYSALILSFRIAGAATLVSIIIGLPIAFILSMKRGKFIDFIDTAVNLPVVMPPTVLGYYILTYLGRKSSIGIFLEEHFGVMIVFTELGAVIAATIVSLPFIIKSSKAAFLSVNKDIINAAILTGAGRLKIFIKIIIPLSWNGVLAGITMAFVRALGDFGTTFMVAGSIPGKTLTMPIAIYNSLQEGKSEYTMFLVAIMTLTAVVVLFTVNTLERKLKRW